MAFQKNPQVEFLQAMKDKPEYIFDDLGRAYRRSPLLVRREKEALGHTEDGIDENIVACYCIFSADGRNMMVTKPGFEARDKAVWFPTEAEALEAKSKELSSKRKTLEKKLKKAEAAEESESQD